MTEPWELTATDALARMRAKELSPVELLASVRARAEVVEPRVNALTEQLADPADDAARESEARFQRGEGIRPLEGLPVALKEEMPVAGWRMRYGSLAIDEGAEHTAPVPERIFAAGAVVHVGRPREPHAATAIPIDAPAAPHVVSGRIPTRDAHPAPTQPVPPAQPVPIAASPAQPSSARPAVVPMRPTATPTEPARPVTEPANATRPTLPPATRPATRPVPSRRASSSRDSFALSRSRINGWAPSETTRPGSC